MEEEEVPEERRARCLTSERAWRAEAAVRVDALVVARARVPVPVGLGVGVSEEGSLGVFVKGLSRLERSVALLLASFVVGGD